MLQGIFPILATQYAGLSEAETGAIYLASGVAVLVAGPCFGWLSDRVSRNLVFAIRSLANTLSSLIYLVSPSLGGIAVGRVVDDVGKAAFRPAWGSLMTQLSSLDPKKRARTMGVMSTGEDMGEIAGPILAGALWSAGGIGAALGLRVVLAVVTEIYTVVLANRVAAAPGRERVLAAPRQQEEA
jgi:MFS family permease